MIYALRDPAWAKNYAAIYLRSRDWHAYDPHGLLEYRALLEGLSQFPYDNYLDEFCDEHFWHLFGNQGDRGCFGVGPDFGPFVIFTLRWNPNTLILLDGVINSPPLNLAHPETDERIQSVINKYSPLIACIEDAISKGHIEERSGKGGFFRPGEQKPKKSINIRI